MFPLIPGHLSEGVDPCGTAAMTAGACFVEGALATSTCLSDARACATAKIDHVYCWKSTSRKLATDAETGRSLPMS
jgi:hypothetical protein